MDIDSTAEWFAGGLVFVFVAVFGRDGQWAIALGLPAAMILGIVLFERRSLKFVPAIVFGAFVGIIVGADALGIGGA